MKLLFATKNAGKLKEVRNILSELGMEILGLGDISIDIDIVEDGETFYDNALIKARALHDGTGLAVLADDSGLCVDHLGGAPGVYSARYSGPGATDDSNMDKLLEELGDLPAEKRSAAFICSMALILEDGRLFSSEGKLKGRIIERKMGDGGFGYDPIFVPEGENRTLAQISLEEKNRISHRKRALEELSKNLSGLAK